MAWWPGDLLPSPRSHNETASSAEQPRSLRRAEEALTCLLSGFWLPDLSGEVGFFTKMLDGKEETPQEGIVVFCFELKGLQLTWDTATSHVRKAWSLLTQGGVKSHCGCTKSLQRHNFPWHTTFSSQYILWLNGNWVVWCFNDKILLRFFFSLSSLCVFYSRVFPGNNFL